MATGDKLIQVKDLKKYYNRGAIKALDGVTVDIDRGDVMVVIGPSGSGKSTIIKLITAEISPTRGKLMVNGYNLNDISEKQIPLMRRTIGVVFQDFRLIEKKTVYENIEGTKYSSVLSLTCDVALTESLPPSCAPTSMSTTPPPPTRWPKPPI